MDTDTTSPARPYGLTQPQIDLLLGGLHQSRVSRKQTMSHVEAWDIRRWLTRVFGFAGWSTDMTDLTLIAEREGENSTGNPCITVIYRATIVLTVKDPYGNVLGQFHGAASGDAINFPMYKLGDAHDFAIKTADSQALKRAAVNLGDQFGLSLYNNGLTDRVIVKTAAYGQHAQLQPDAPVVAEPVPEYAADGQQQERPAAGCGTQLLSEALRTADRPTTPTGTVQQRSAAHPERPVNVPGSIAWDVDDLLNNWGPRSDLIEAIDTLVELHEQAEGAGWLAAPVPVPALLQKHEAAPPVGPLGDVLICARKHLEWRAKQ